MPLPATPESSPGPAPHAPAPTLTAEPPILYRLWLHALAWLLVIGTGILIFMGGRVTTMGAGLAVPDWPTTFHHNMFAVPFNLWWKNSPVFAEHSHRLMGSTIGFITILLALGLWFTQKKRRWLRWFGVLLLAMVIIQGIMGGLRVTDKSEVLAFVHGIFAQVFFCCTIFAATAIGPVWLRLRQKADWTSLRGQGLRITAAALLGVILLQVALGSSLRHTSSALAIPDFPANYGHILPPTSQTQLEQDAAALSPMLSKHLHLTSNAPSPYTLTQVWLNFSHRIGAGVVTILALVVMLWAPVVTGGRRELMIPIMLLAGLLALQIMLGASVIWSGRWAPFATAHQTCGAILFGASTWLATRIFLVTHTLNAIKAPHELKKTATQRAAGSGSGGGSAATGVESPTAAGQTAEPQGSIA